MAPGIPVCSFESEESSSTTLWQIGVCDVIPAVYVPSRYSHRAQGSRRYVAAFYCGDFWVSNLIFLELDGNEESLARLRAIIAKNRKEAPDRWDVHILNFDAPLTESVVCDLVVAEDEVLRSLLIAHLAAPFSDGWKDCNKWVVRNTAQFKLDGQLAMLPRTPPEAYSYLYYLETEWENYPDHLVGFYLRFYTRPWARSAYSRIAAVD